MPHWQTIIVVLIVLIAAVYLAYRGWLVVSGKKSAGGCGSGACGASCGKSEEASDTGIVSRPFVGIDELRSPHDTAKRERSDAGMQ